MRGQLASSTPNPLSDVTYHSIHHTWMRRQLASSTPNPAGRRSCDSSLLSHSTNAEKPKSHRRRVHLMRRSGEEEREENHGRRREDEEGGGRSESAIKEKHRDTRVPLTR